MEPEFITEAGAEDNTDSQSTTLSPGFHEEDKNFGIVKKGKYKPASDFAFEFTAEVISCNPQSSGFIVKLTPERSDDSEQCTRLCYFTTGSTNKKADFLRELNSSYKHACLQCSFSDKEVSEFIQYKKRTTAALPVKFAVSHVGMQADGSWVLGSSAHIS